MKRAVYSVAPPVNNLEEAGHAERIAEFLQARFPEVDQHDCMVISLRVFEQLASVLSPSRTRDYENKLNSHLQKITDLCRELNHHVEAVENLTYLGPDVFEKAWRRNLFGFEVVSNRDGAEMEVVHLLTGAEGKPVFVRTALASLEAVAEETFRIRSERVTNSRPKQQDLLQVCYILIKAWTALNLIRGQSVAAAFPDGKNGGFRGATELVRHLQSAQQMPLLEHLGPRTDATIYKAFGKAKKELTRLLLDRPYCEETERWHTLGTNSFIGLEILSQAARIGTRNELADRSKFIDEFFDLRHKWLRRREDALENFNPF